MQNDFKSKAQASLTSSESYLTNMLDMSAITLNYAFKATPPFTDTSVKNRLWQLLPRCSCCIFVSAYRYIAFTTLAIIAVFLVYLRQFLIDLHQIYRHSSVPKNTSLWFFPAS